MVTLQNLVAYVVQQLVDQPERTSVEMVREGDSLIFKITVDARDRGKVIGKDGQTIKALRAFLNVISAENLHIVMDLVQAA